MDILKHIFQRNDAQLNSYYSQNNSEQTELLLALSLYVASKDESSINTLKIVAQAYEDDDNMFRRKFAQSIKAHIGLDSVFFHNMKNSNILKNFLQEYHVSVNERVNFWSDKLKSENVTSHNSITLNDLAKIQQILLEVIPSKNQQKMPDQFLPTSNFLDLRICDLKNITGKEHQSGLEEELLINVYTEFKVKNLPLTEIDKFINKTREIRDDFIQYSMNDDKTISPLFACLHKDIISALTETNNLSRDLKEFNYHNLWRDISKYTTANISEADFEIIHLPQELGNVSTDNKVRQAIWVLKKNGQIAFGGRQTLNFSGKHEVRHIDLANGESVLSAGTILFSEDMTRVIAINPGSGHYRPSIDSCSHMKEALDKSNLNTKDIVICDLDWKPNMELSSAISLPTSEKVSDSILSIRKKCLVSNSSKNDRAIRIN
jgi:hypothetical protein